MSGHEDEPPENQRDESIKNNSESSQNNFEQTNKANTKIEGDNSGTAVSVGQNNGEVTVGDQGDKETKPTTKDVVLNGISTILRAFFRTSVGRFLDIPLRVTGWSILLVLFVASLSVFVEMFAPIFGYEQIGQMVAPLAERAIQIDLLITTRQDVGIFVMVALPTGYATIRSVTKCNKCREPFVLRFKTKFHYDRARPNSQSDGYIIPKEWVFECKFCDSNDNADQHEHTHAQQNMPSD